MNKFTVVLASAILLLGVFISVPARAAGGGGGNAPKGVITQVNSEQRTVVFEEQGADKKRTLDLAEKVDADSIERDRLVMVSLKTENDRKLVTDVSVMFMDLIPMKVISLLIVGLVGGLLSGFIGSGGAFVLTPSMMSLGAPGAVAVASNMCHKFPKAMVGGYKRWKYGQADLKLGLVMAASAIVGVQIGIRIQKMILDKFGDAGSNLYVSIAFVVILVLVGTYVFWDAYRLKKHGQETETSRLALALQKVQIPPMIRFKTAGMTLSLWVTIPVGLATGMLAATIAVGGFIGVPGMIYVVGASAIVSSATELVIAFIMGMWGSVQWALDGLIDIRMTLLILAGSLFGVQLGAMGTTYVKDYTVKIVMGAVMLIVAVSRGAKIPIYLEQLDALSLNNALASVLDKISFWALVTALGTAGVIITGAMVKGIVESKRGEAP